MREGQECLWVLKTRSGEGMLVCREAASADEAGGREGVRDNWWATDLKRAVSEERRCRDSRTAEVKGWCSVAWCKGYCSQLVRRRFRSC